MTETIARIRIGYLTTREYRRKKRGKSLVAHKREKREVSKTNRKTNDNNKAK